jgi:hypothetical protein
MSKQSKWRAIVMVPTRIEWDGPRDHRQAWRRALTWAEKQTRAAGIEEDIRPIVLSIEECNEND